MHTQLTLLSLSLINDKETLIPSIGGRGKGKLRVKHIHPCSRAPFGPNSYENHNIFPYGLGRVESGLMILEELSVAN